nr:hypothetical protein Iba_chr10fCG11480 [Ipomoea batatas]
MLERDPTSAQAPERSTGMKSTTEPSMGDFGSIETSAGLELWNGKRLKNRRTYQRRVANEGFVSTGSQSGGGACGAQAVAVAAGEGVGRLGVTGNPIVQAASV